LDCASWDYFGPFRLRGVRVPEGAVTCTGMNFSAVLVGREALCWRAVDDDQRILARLLAARSTEEWFAVAGACHLVRDGLVDLSGRRIRFNHRDLDITRFRLDGADLTGSVLVNPQGDGVSFRRCVLRKVRLIAEPGHRASLRRRSLMVHESRTRTSDRERWT
jgi:hypothetical protein